MLPLVYLRSNPAYINQASQSYIIPMPGQTINNPNFYPQQPYNNGIQNRNFTPNATVQELNPIQAAQNAANSSPPPQYSQIVNPVETTKQQINEENKY